VTGSHFLATASSEPGMWSWYRPENRFPSFSVSETGEKVRVYPGRCDFSWLVNSLRPERQEPIEELFKAGRYPRDVPAIRLHAVLHLGLVVPEVDGTPVLAMKR
jgi:hypothetical protein